MWRPGQFLAHRFNPELGTGRVVAVAGRRLEVQFPQAGKTLQLAADPATLEPLTLAVGGAAQLVASGEEVTLAGLDDGRWRLADGRRVDAEALWPVAAPESLVLRLARGDLDAREDWRNRLDGLRLRRLREAEGLGTFLGGRIQLFPHQLYAAERACRTDPVRWLFADEVGLGKTVEACLVMTRLLHRGRAERVLVVAPETLTVQWLGELWRKYHQVFVLIDDQRLADVVKDHGSDTNPFEVYRRAIVSLERLATDRRLVEHATAAGIDLLVVDEAHHLERPEGHPGNPAYRAIAPLAARGRHVLLLTATPLEEDAHGFFRLLQLLRPEAFPEAESFAARLARREPLPPCTSATRRRDVGGLPPRQPRPIDLADDAATRRLDELIERLRGRSARDELARRRKIDLVWRATASPAALEPRLEASDRATRDLVAAAKAADPRLAWLVAEAAGWRRLDEKTLVFVAHRESLDWLRSELESRARQRVAIFHEELSAERRDLEVAQFRLPGQASILVSTEAGGEGRNFEFCHRLVLFDLPWSPGVVEQRIGRLDRIGRQRPTEIVYFRPPRGLALAVARMHEAIGVFREPLGGVERELRQVTVAVETLAAEGAAVDDAAFATAVDATREARGRVESAAYHELHRDRYRPEMAAGLLARVPPELDATHEEVVIRAAARFGFGVEAQSAPRTWLVELGGEALVDRLPGVPPESRFLGTFDRQQAVEDESLDFFASGHPLVEGVLGELEEGRRGRVGLFQVQGSERDDFALVALYADPEAVYEVVAVDRRGRRRDDLAGLLAGAELEHVDRQRFVGQPGWSEAMRRLAEHLPADREPLAVAAVRFRPAG